MMKVRSIALAASVMLSATPVSWSQELTSYHASACQGNGKLHDNALTIDARGLLNKLSDRSIWVTCPVPVTVDVTGVSPTNTLVFVGLWNRGETPRKISCIFTGVGSEESFISQSRTVAVDPSDSGELAWQLLDTELALASFSCKLPPKTGLFMYLSAFVPS